MCEVKDTWWDQAPPGEFNMDWIKENIKSNVNYSISLWSIV